MAFSTSYPSIPNEWEPDVDILAKTQLQQQASSTSGSSSSHNKKWASVPTLLTSPQLDLYPIQNIDLEHGIGGIDFAAKLGSGPCLDISNLAELEKQQKKLYFRQVQQKQQQKQLFPFEGQYSLEEDSIEASVRGNARGERIPVEPCIPGSLGSEFLPNQGYRPKGVGGAGIFQEHSSSTVDGADSPFSPKTGDSAQEGTKGSFRCDLLSELESDQDNVHDSKKDLVEPDMMSSFDDNGNPLDLEEADGNVKEMVGEDNVEKVPGMSAKSSKGSRDLTLALKKSTDSEMSMKTSNVDDGGASGAMTSSSEKGENTIRLGFKSNLQKSVEGFMDEPKYFINAAALSEDLDAYTMPSLESVGGFDSNEETDVVEGNNRVFSEQQHQHRKDGDGLGKKETTSSSKGPVVSCNNAVNEMSNNPPTVMIKPRVPMSKSFPDIIQTTFVDDRCEFSSKNSSSNSSNSKILKTEAFMEKGPSFNDLAADSLEELPTKGDVLMSGDDKRRLSDNMHFDFKIETKLSEIMEMSQSQSQMGILAEKPPEAWVIDFNSLSLDSEAFENSEMSSSIMSKSSNPTSLAYFIDIDDKSTDEEGSKQVGGPLKSPEKKKIFSMFVDFGSSNEGLDKPQLHPVYSSSQSTAKPSRLPVHRNVMNVLKEGEAASSHQSVSPICVSKGASSATAASTNFASKKRTFQYPSPILSHKMAGDAGGSRTSLTTAAISPTSSHSSSALKNIEVAPVKNSVPNPIKDSLQDEPLPNISGNSMEMSTTSNRSSLHVATDFDMAFSSSFISSMETSGLTAEEACSKGPCFKLGKDLLRMFLDAINTDVNICVNGRYLKAHKCILSSRSQYFAALFSGQLLEKAGNTITLEGFSYNVVHFAMCHIYSGTNEIPDSIDLLELATLTDLLGLEGLRENISQTIRVKFCHNFHRPCTGCISGVLECFPIALSYEMDELHRKMTKWICKHFVRIWPTKAFANLGDELIDKCLRYSVNHLSVDNILDITLGCDQLLTTMPSVRWTEPIFCVVNQLSKACVQFIGENFSQVLQSQRFLLFGKGQQWNISRIEGTFVEAMMLMKPDEACLSHTALTRLIELGTETIDEVEWSTMFVEFLRMLAKEIERYLIANASKAVLSKYWEHLGQDVRKRICTSSFMGYDKAGNKIVKGNATSGVGLKAANPGRLTPSERSSSISSIKSGVGGTKTATRQHSEQHNNKTGFGHVSNFSSSGNVPAAKIASVRPIQNVFSTTSSSADVQTSTLPKSSGSSTHPSKATKGHPTQLSRRKTAEDKKKSFNSSPRNSVVSSSLASANRTPLNPLTPITPSKPGPGAPSLSSATSSAGKTRGSRSSTTSKNSSNANPSGGTPTAQGTKTFITNSARANSVTKPNIRQKNVSSTSTRSTTPRTSNLSQPSRYASSIGNRDHLSRGSMSGSEKSEKASAATTPGDVKSRHHTISSRNCGGGSTFVASVSSREKRDKSTTSNHYNKNPIGGASNTQNSSNSSSRKTSAKSASRHSSAVTASPDPMRDSIMSKSTIENDSGEPKMRTLAEIGRSSTFSKDEPTILGKLDHNQTLSIDFS